MINNNLSEHIFFDAISNNPSVQEQRCNLVMELISESLFTYSHNFYNKKISIIEHYLREIFYYIHLFPVVNASVEVINNRIDIYLYTLFAANKITHIEDLLDLLYDHENDSYNSVSQIIKSSYNSFYNMELVKEYLESFGKNKKIITFSEYNKVIMTLPKEVFGSYKYSCFAYNVMQLILLHELGHWHFYYFNNQKKQEFFSFAYSKLVNYYSKSYIKENYNMVNSWIHELIADNIAIMVFTLLNKHNINDKQCRRECYISLGLYFGLLLLEDINNNNNLSHPSAKLRQDIAIDLYAHFFEEELNIPKEIYYEKEIMEWRIIKDYFEEIISQYKNKIY